MSEGMKKRMHEIYKESKRNGMSRIDTDVYISLSNYITKETGTGFNNIKWDQKTKVYITREQMKEVIQIIAGYFYIDIEENDMKEVDDYYEKELALFGGHIVNCVKK